MDEKVVDQICSILSADHPVISVHVYGSFAKGTETVESDIDLAVLYPPGEVPTLEEQITYIGKISDLLEDRPVDLLILNDANYIIATQAVHKGKILKVVDERALKEYHLRLLSDYAEFKEMRKPMEEGLFEWRYYGRS